MAKQKREKPYYMNDELFNEVDQTANAIDDMVDHFGGNDDDFLFW